MKKDNPFCRACKEKDCVVSLDGTCAMIRKYLAITPCDSGERKKAAALAKAVWVHAQRRPLSWTAESVEREIVKCLNAINH